MFEGRFREAWDCEVGVHMGSYLVGGGRSSALVGFALFGGFRLGFWRTITAAGVSAMELEKLNAQLLEIDAGLISSLGTAVSNLRCPKISKPMLATRNCG
ncbi:hypothetical protein Droror1_Dr00024116 [Drosera rotundifolia]